MYNSRDILRLAFVLLCINIYLSSFNSLRGLSYPYNTFLITPLDRFGDFFKVMDALGIANTWTGSNKDFVYYEHLLPVTASLYLIFAKLILLVGNKYLVYFSLLALTFSILFRVCRKCGNDKPIFWLILASYPMLFAVDRGNLAMVVFLFLLIALSTENIIVATLLLSLAGSIKLTPFVFVIPILLSRPLSLKWVSSVLLLVLGWTVIINLLSIEVNGYYLTPSVSDPLVLFSGLVDSYTQGHVNSMAGLGYGSSLYMPVTYIVGKMCLPTESGPFTLVLIVGALIGLLLLIRKQMANTFHTLMVKKNMIFVLTTSFVLFSPVTADYYLLVMLIPLLMYPKTTYSLGYAAAYGILLGAKNTIFVDYMINPISLQVFINPMLLLLMLFSELNLIAWLKRDSGDADPADAALISRITYAFQEVRSRTLAVSKLGKDFAITIALLALSAYLFGVSVYSLSESKTRSQNIAAGLPYDFDVKNYLKMNPAIEEYWKSIGIYEQGELLYGRTRDHYRGFGIHQGWIYNRPIQRIFYPKFLAILPAFLQVAIAAGSLLFAFLFADRLTGFTKWLRVYVPHSRIGVVLSALRAASDRIVGALQSVFPEILLAGLIVLLFAFGSNQYEIILKEDHNLATDLPIDFDPQAYLRLNPQLETFWISQGIEESGPKLWQHAEDHYKGFGSKDGWGYKDLSRQNFTLQFLYDFNIARRSFTITMLVLWLTITGLVYAKFRFGFLLSSYKKEIALLASVLVVVGAVSMRLKMAPVEKRNLDSGVPIDFDPKTYLQLNPQLERFWKSQGVHDTGTKLLDHATDHYRSFGSRDKWRYRDAFHKVYYPSFMGNALIVWQVILPLSLVAMFFAVFKQMRPTIPRGSLSDIPGRLVLSVKKFGLYLSEQSKRVVAINRYGKQLIIFACVAFVAGVFALRIKMAPTESHNLEVGLPPDFNPAVYLQLNPTLEEYWRSIGVLETGQKLLDHAEVHYKEFGARDQWKYRGPFQKYYYPQFAQANFLFWQVYIPLLLALVAFLWIVTPAWRRTAVILLLIGIFLIGALLLSTPWRASRETHNIEMGLPADFDPQRYLELNPQLVEFWSSQGIHESGEQLLRHAEEHYKAFGSKDGWRYK